MSLRSTFFFAMRFFPFVNQRRCLGSDKALRKQCFFYVVKLMIASVLYKKRLLFPAGICCSAFAQENGRPMSDHWGGTAAGIPCARLGAKTIILECSPWRYAIRRRGFSH